MSPRRRLLKTVRLFSFLTTPLAIGLTVFVFAVEWADLPIVDISRSRTPEGRAELAPQMHDAMRTHGFLYIVNHGLTQAQVRAFTRDIPR